MRAIDRRYLQVVFTYLRRPVIPIVTLMIPVAWGASWLIEWISGHRRLWIDYNLELRTLRSLVASVPFICLLALPAIVIGHVREQLVNWRAALTPGFRLPHLTIAAVTLTLVTLILASATYHELAIGGPHNRNLSFAGLLAIVLTLMTVAAWWSLFWWPWLALVLLPILTLLLVNQRATDILASLAASSSRSWSAFRFAILGVNLIALMGLG